MPIQKGTSLQHHISIKCSIKVSVPSFLLFLSTILPFYSFFNNTLFVGTLIFSNGSWHCNVGGDKLDDDNGLSHSFWLFFLSLHG